MINIKQKVDIACEVAGMSRAELARRLNTTPSAFLQRLDRGKFTQDELEQIAAILDCEYFSGFKFNNGIEVK